MAPPRGNSETSSRTLKGKEKQCRSRDREILKEIEEG